MNDPRQTLADRIFGKEIPIIWLKVQAVLIGMPDSLTAQKRGFHNLVNVRIPYQGPGVATTRKIIRESPDIVRRYVKSQIAAVHRFKTDRETGIRVLAKYVAVQDKEILQNSYDENSTDDKFLPKQYPTLDGMKNILEPRGDGPEGPPSLRTMSI